VFLRAPLTKVPAGATVSSAKIRFYNRTDESGSRILKVQPVTSAWNSNITWSKRPTSAGTVVSTTKASPAAGAAWDFDVTAQVQEVVSGQRVDRGWELFGDSSVTNLLRLFGSKAARRKPVLLVTYSTVPDAPSNLHPAGGSVSVSKPVVTFDADDNITALQVQVDPAANATSAAFDSGSVAAAGGMLDLSTTTYAGIASGATTYWRARQRNAGGWSDWSDWVTMTLLPKPTLTMLNPPAGNIDDGTPPVQWSLAGTQTAWQARLLDASGDVLSDSGYTPGTDTDWTPTKGLKKDGQAGTIELLIWDSADRVSTPGDPEYAMLTRAVTYVLDPTVDPMDSLMATTPWGGTPDVVLAGSRAQMPDEVVIFRDGTAVATLAGPDVFVGSSFRWVDSTAPMARSVTYRVAPRVNGKTAKGGPTRSIVPFSRGIWLQSMDTGERVLLYTDGDMPEQSQPETSIVHSPLNSVDGMGQVVRRRLVRYQAQGAIKGVIMDPPGSDADYLPDAATCEALMREWADADAGDLYWLNFAGFTGSVIIGDVEFSERDNPQQEARRMLNVEFNWWGQQ
jgi:hypothetical protein